MQRELLSSSGLAAALRAGGCLRAHEVERTTAETNGDITGALKKRFGNALETLWGANQASTGQANTWFEILVKTASSAGAACASSY